MKILSTTIEEFGPHISKKINWASDDGLTCLTGDNGTGKTMLIEGVFAALYGDFPSYKGTIYDAVRQGGSGRALVESVFEYDGRRYRVTRRVQVTARTRTQAAVICAANSETPLAGPKVRDFDAYIDNLLGSSTLALATWFASYRGVGDICELLPSARSDLISTFIKTADLGSIAVRAKSLRIRANVDIEHHQQRVRDFSAIEAPVGDTAAAEAELAKEELAIEILEGELREVMDDIARMTSQVERANASERLTRDYENRVELRDRLKSELAKLKRRVAARAKLEAERNALLVVKTEYERLCEARDYRAQIRSLEQKVESAIAAIEASTSQLVARRISAEATLSARVRDNPFDDVTDEMIDALPRLSDEMERLSRIEADLRATQRTATEYKTTTMLLREAEKAVTAAIPTKTDIVDVATILREHEALVANQRALASERRQHDVNRFALNHNISARRTEAALYQQRRKDVDKSVAAITEISVKTEYLTIIEQAFGRSGIQALLIEYAIKPFEQMASEMMQVATEGRFDVRIETTKENRDGSIAEQVSIIVADHAGERDIYQFSGGERRILSTIIRLAFARWIAQRSGKHYETIFFDEAFDSLDPQHVDMLTEMFSNVTDYFDNIIIVTPNPAFAVRIPNRIEI